MVLSLLFLGCERDDVKQPSSQILSQQEAMNLFFKTYQRKEDGFRDEMVSRLLAMNDSTGIIFDLSHRYGQPRWEVGRTQYRKSGNMLFVPIRAAEKDSITAVFAFIDSTHISYLKIFEGNSDDTLTSDLVLHYQNTLYGKAKAGERFTKPHLGDSKEVVWVPDCYDVYTSVDHGATLNYSYTSCSYRAVYVASTTDLAFYPTGNEGNPGDGGGDSGGDEIDEQEEEDCARPVLYEESQTIKNTRNGISRRDHCASNKIIDSTKNVRYEIDPCMGTSTYGEYEYNTNEVQFRNVSEVNEARLYEELMHAYQNQFYNGGLGQYGPGMPGFTNMEFEAKVMYAIYWYQKGFGELPVLFKDLSIDEQGTFMAWFDEIINNGLTSIALKTYDDLIIIFNNNNPEYAGCVSESFPKLSVIQDLLAGCPKKY
ncbi:MAG: hypothetical protein F9K37_10550 [Bacteroidales bacterium]|nr:MAG: hypothetical protein F9K37_10550 [Bacteroidales bacterium]